MNHTEPKRALNYSKRANYADIEWRTGRMSHESRPASILSIEDASAVEMEIARVLQQDAARNAFTKRVTETVNAREMVEDDCAADDCPFSNELQCSLGRTVVVGVYKAQYEVFLF